MRMHGNSMRRVQVGLYNSLDVLCPELSGRDPDPVIQAVSPVEALAHPVVGQPVNRGGQAVVDHLNGYKTITVIFLLLLGQN